MHLPYCTYILFSNRDHKLYIRFSSNLSQRLKDHSNGKVASTKGRRPLELIYGEFHSNKMDAIRREKYFKTTSGRKALKLMLREKLDILQRWSRASLIAIGSLLRTAVNVSSTAVRSNIWTSWWQLWGFFYIHTDGCEAEYAERRNIETPSNNTTRTSFLLIYDF